MKYLLLFLPLSCVAASADNTPLLQGSRTGFASFLTGTDHTEKKKYCIVTLDGTYRGKASIIPASGKPFSDLSITDSTGKTYTPDNVLISMKAEKGLNQEKEFIIQFSFSEWPPEDAEWLRIRGDVPVTCTEYSSTDPAEVDLLHPEEVKIPLPPNNGRQDDDIADPARMQFLTLSMKKLKDGDGGRNGTDVWEFLLAYPTDFRYRDLKLEDMQGRAVPAGMPPSLCGFSASGGGGTSTYEYLVLPRSREKMKVRILYLDPRNFETRHVSVDVSLGIGGSLNKGKREP